MTQTFGIPLALLFVFSFGASASPPRETPGRISARKDGLALMHRADDWQSAHLVMPPDDRNWERGTWYTGVMEAWKATHDPRFLKQALAWGRQHQWQVGTEQLGPNRLFCAETWLELYFVRKDRSMIQPVIRWLDTAAPNSPAGAQRWFDIPWRDHISYADSLYAAPAFAMLARATGDKKYLDIMNTFFWGVTGELLDKEEGLYYRDVRYAGQKTANGRKVLWSRGSGWVFAGIARVLDYLPKDDPERGRYTGLFKTMAATLIKRQGSDGLWRPNLDDPQELPMPESSGTGFFCFGLAWGIDHGIRDRAKYLPAVQKAWAGLYRSISPEGKVLFGQQEAAGPSSVEQESTHEYVTGAFLLAGSGVYKLTGTN